MTSDVAIVLSSEMLWTAILICAPILGLTLLVGLIVSIFQVVTQIQEMSLTFIPKMLTAAMVLIALARIFHHASEDSILRFWCTEFS